MVEPTRRIHSLNGQASLAGLARRSCKFLEACDCCSVITGRNTRRNPRTAMSRSCNGTIQNFNNNQNVIHFDMALNGSPDLQAGDALEFAVNFETVRCCVCMEPIGVWGPRVGCAVCVESFVCRTCVYQCVNHRLLRCPICVSGSFSHFCFEFLLTDLMMQGIEFGSSIDFLQFLSSNRLSVNEDGSLAVIPIVFGVGQLFTVESQLNGNNGEWTNTDDMQPVRGRHIRNMAAQGVPVADGRQGGPFLPRPVGVQRRARRNAGAPLANNPFAVLADGAVPAVEAGHRGGENRPPREVAEPEVHWQVNVPAGCAFPIYYDGERYSHLPTHQLVDPDVVVQDVIRSGPGWFVTKRGKGKSELTRSVVLAVDLHSYKNVDGKLFREVHDWVLVPIMAKVRRLVGGCEVTDKIVKAATAVAFKEVGSSSVAIQEFATKSVTLALRVQQQAYDLRVVESADMPVFVGSERHPNADVNALPIVREARGRPFALMDSDAPVVAFAHRGDYTICNVVGDVDLSQFDEDGGVYRPTERQQGLLAGFEPEETFLWESLPPNKFRTAYTNFVGLGTPEFVEYACNAQNLTSGLKRLLAARPGEEHYRWHANEFSKRLFIYEHSCAYPIVESSVLCDIELAISGREYSREYVPAPNDNPCLPLEQEIRDDCIDFIVRQAHVSLEKVRRTTIQAAVDNLKTSAHWLYYRGFDAYLSLMEPILGRQSAADIQHVKRKLRQAYVQGVLVHDTENIMVRRLNAAVKRELAKFGKPARLYVSYDAGCMYANELPEYVKMCIDGHHHVSSGAFDFDIYVMAKPRTGILDDLFNQMYRQLELHNSVFVMIYSDDQVYGGNVHGQSFLFNVDISSNDSSQDKPAFGYCALAMACFNPAGSIGLIKQCRLPIRVSNPGDKNDHFDIQFSGLFEGSGSVLTTILNHSGSLLAAFGFCYLLSVYADHSLGIIEQCIKRAFAFVGHSVTIDNCAASGELIFEKMQFLKHSPVRMVAGNGTFLRWGSMQNLACVFRSLGTTWDSLTARKLGVSQSCFDLLTDDQRLDLMCWQVTQGLCNEPESCIKTALFDRFTPSVKTSESWWTWLTSGSMARAAKLWLGVGGDNGTERSTGKIAIGNSEGVTNSSVFFGACSHHHHSVYESADVSSICARYDMEVSELDELLELIHRVRSGTIVCCTALSKLYFQDYGVPLE